MSLLKIVHYPDPVLLTVGKPVGEDEFKADLQKARRPICLKRCMKPAVSGLPRRRSMFPKDYS